MQLVNPQPHQSAPSNIHPAGSRTSGPSFGDEGGGSAANSHSRWVSAYPPEPCPIQPRAKSSLSCTFPRVGGGESASASVLGNFTPQISKVTRDTTSNPPKTHPDESAGTVLPICESLTSQLPQTGHEYVVTRQQTWTSS